MDANCSSNNKPMNQLKQLNRPLISVIVPIYNVEKYVRKCLDSLVNQSLKQIEVICIDDGSTDRSGLIVDEYCNTDDSGNGNKWPLIRVMHTQNRGLSAARNRGIDEARAEWIMFVDSDDWVEDQFCEMPWKAAVENAADLVIFQNYYTSENGRIKRKKSYMRFGFLDHETAVDIGQTQAWNKLYKKNLFKGLRYPEGHVYEDYAITHQLVYRAENLVSVPAQLYYYRYRKGSICHSTSSEKDRLVLSKRRYRELIALGYPEHKARAQLLGSALRCCGRTNKRSSVYIEASELLRRVEEIPSECSDREKMMMAIWRFNKRLYGFVYQGYMGAMK